MRYRGRQDVDVPEAAIEAARALPPCPGMEGLVPVPSDRPVRVRDWVLAPDNESMAYAPIRSTDVLPGKPVHKRGHRI